jgi:hypothetical protein
LTVSHSFDHSGILMFGIQRNSTESIAPSLTSKPTETKRTLKLTGEGWEKGFEPIGVGWFTFAVCSGQDVYVLMALHDKLVFYRVYQACLKHSRINFVSTSSTHQPTPSTMAPM